MPVALYNMDKFIQDILERMGLELDDTTRGSVIDYYKKLISCSIGSNPVGIKRLFNAYLLLKKIYGTQAELDQTGQTILQFFACSYPSKICIIMLLRIRMISGMMTF